MKYAIFFDLDGTLWDARSIMAKAWSQVMKKLNYDVTFDVAQITTFMGLTPQETMKRAFPFLDENLYQETFKSCFQEELLLLKKKQGKLYQDVKATLKELARDYPLYIVSNCDQGYIETFLAVTKLEKYFQGHLCQGDTSLDKDQNIIYLQKKEHLDQIIYLGDTYKDYTLASKANAIFIHAQYGFGGIFPCPYHISSLKEAPCLIRKIIKNEENNS
jgi:phosphoglycolate phosphatase